MWEEGDGLVLDSEAGNFGIRSVVIMYLFVVVSAFCMPNVEEGCRDGTFFGIDCESCPVTKKGDFLGLMVEEGGRVSGDEKVICKGPRAEVVLCIFLWG